MFRPRVWILMVISLMASACVPRARYDESQSALKNAMAARENLEQQLASCTSDKDACHATRSNLEKDSKKLVAVQTELTSAQVAVGRVRKIEEAEASRMRLYKRLQDQVKPLSDAGQLQLKLQQGRLVLALPEGILFDSGKADLKPDGQLVLDQVAQLLKGVEGRNFQVQGHTDNAALKAGGKYANNWELSSARALVVVQYLVGRGVEPARLSAAGFGEFMPASSNDTDEGRAQNRRIEIALQPSVDEMPWKSPDGTK